MGDFNARHLAWNCISNNKTGITLLDFCIKHGFEISAPGEPTHFPKRGAPSIIDMFLLKNIKYHSVCESLNVLSSDHNPIAILLHEKIIKKSNNTKT